MSASSAMASSKESPIPWPEVALVRRRTGRFVPVATNQEQARPAAGRP